MLRLIIFVQTCSYFMSPDSGVTLAEFQRSFTSREELFCMKHDTALEFIAQHHQKIQNTTEKPRIIVFIDDILKASRPEELLRNMLNQMETASPFFTSLDVLSTTLDLAVLESQRDGKTRYVQAIPLPALCKLEILFPPEENGLVFEIATRCGGVRLIQC